MNKKLILIPALIVLIFLLFIEILVRKLEPEIFAKNKLLTLTDNSIYSYKPNAKMYFEKSEFTIDVKINSKGMVDIERDYIKPEGTKRIVMLGDSITTAFQVRQNESFSSRLDVLLEDSGKSKGFPNLAQEPNYEVLNMGLGGSGTTPQVIILEKEGIKYEPDIVILNIVVINDITKVDIRVSGDIPKEVFEENIDLKDYEFEVTKIQKLKYLIHRNYFTYSYTLRAINNIKNRGIPVYLEAEVYKKEYSKNTEENLDKLKILLRHLKRYCDEKNIEFFVVLIPTKEQVDERKLAEMSNIYALTDLDIKKPQRILNEFLKENNITTIDLLPEFEKRNINNSFYFEIDGHWNPEGHKLASEIIYGEIG